MIQAGESQDKMNRLVRIPSDNRGLNIVRWSDIWSVSDTQSCRGRLAGNPASEFHFSLA